MMSITESQKSIYMQVALEILKPYKKKSYQQYHTQTDLNWSSEIFKYHKN
jgi:hypothetical protein